MASGIALALSRPPSRPPTPTAVRAGGRVITSNRCTQIDEEPRIGPAPPGYRYGILDGDLVKLAVGTMLVVDAIEGLVR